MCGRKASLVSELMEADRTPRYDKNELIDFSHAIDLTASTDDQGVVTWRNSPEGQWLVLRLFAASTVATPSTDVRRRWVWNAISCR